MNNNQMRQMTWEEVPKEIKEEIAKANTEIILEIYDTEEYHNPEIQTTILAEHSIELI